MRRLVNWVFVLGLAMVMLLISARLVGALTKPSPLLEIYQCSPQPCWHEIHPGTTSLDDAKLILQSDSSLSIDKQNSDPSFHRVCWIDDVSGGGCLFGGASGGYMASRFPQSPYHAGLLTFADAVSLFGPPTSVMVCYNMTDEHQLFIALYFPGSILVSGRPFDLSQLTDRISFSTTVDEIDYHFKPISTLSPWKGFVPITDIRYC